MARQTYVALLRGINVSGRRKVSMADLRTLFGDLGSEDVTTYVQSGNVVFRSRADSGELIDAIRTGIGRALGLDVTVLLRTKAELARIVAANPFVSEGREATKLHVTFLAGAPARERVRALEPKRGGADEFRVVGREVYLHCPNGYGRTKLDNAYFEKQLDVAATTRNWKTVTKLAELARA
jgi:uncharacterized protein (DUF1697 family)